MIQRPGKRPKGRRSALSITLLVTVLSLLLIFFIGRRLFPAAPQFYSLLLEKNDQPLRLLNGESLQFHPQDNVRIIEVATNVLFNLRIRLAAKDLDVAALQNEKLPLSALLPSQALLSKNQFRVVVKRDNVDIGFVDFVVEPYVEDWLEKVERTIDPERRAEILEQARAFAPGDRRIRLRLLEEYKSLKKWPKAAQLLEEMIREEDDPKLLVDLLEVHESTPNPNGVISVLRRLLARDPQSTELRFRLARTLEKNDKRDEAIKQYEILLDRIKPDEKLTIYKTLGYLYSKSHQVDKAIDAYLKAIELDKKDVNLYYNLAGLYEKAGDKNRANQYLGEAVKIKPDDLESRLLLAEDLMNRGNLREAENHLAFVLQKKPDSVRALVLMSNILEKQGDKKRLIQTYEKLLLLDPNSETLVYNLGVLEYETGNFLKSIPHFERYVKWHPREVSPHRYLFEAYKKEKKDALAFSEAKTLLSLNPKDVSPYHFIFEHLSSRGNFKEVAELMRNGVSSFPDNTDLRQYLILAYLRVGNEDLALREMGELLKLKPKDVTLLLQFATLGEKQGKDKEALETYERILALSPNHKEAREGQLSLLFRQARVEEREGNIKEALSLYKKILDVAPGNEEAEESYLRLRLKTLPLEEGRR